MSKQLPQLLRRLSRFQAAKVPLVLLKFSGDDRYSTTEVQTHDRNAMSALAVTRLSEALHAFDVAIKNRGSDVHAERGNRAGCRPPDTGQGFEFLNAVRKESLMLRANLLRGFVKVAGPGVIAEPCPQMQHLIHRRCRQYVHVGKARYEPLIIGNDRGHLGLLQHDLRHPDPVGRGVLLPGQIVPAMRDEPVQNLPCKCVLASHSA